MPGYQLPSVGASYAPLIQASTPPVEAKVYAASFTYTTSRGRISSVADRQVCSGPLTQYYGD